MKRKLFSMVLALAATLLATLVASTPPQKRSTSADEAMGAALHQEEVEGNLERAISLYKKVVAEAGSNRALAAKALLQMGRCYEKLGNVEARKAYERIVREYRDQSELAAHARARLAAMESPSRPAGLSVRRVWGAPNIDICTAPVSPDGRYLAYHNETDTELVVRDLVTGEERRLTKREANSPRHLVDEPVFSPDGKQIAYDWSNPDGFEEVRVVGVDGSPPRVLYRNPEVDADPAAWSPDGKHVLAGLFRKDGQLDIALIPVAGGPARILKTIARWGKFVFSPDSRYVAYDSPAREGAHQRDIFLIAVDGTHEAVIVEHPANDYVLAWAPEGNTILFASDRSGSNGLWAIRMADGKPQGAPQLLKPDIGRIEGLGFTRNGSFYYSTGLHQSDIYVAELDPETGQVVSPPKPATQHYTGSHVAAVWSEDGKQLIYSSQPHGRMEPLLSVLSLETGTERDVVPLFRLNPPTLQHDGRSLVAAGADAKGNGIFRIDLVTGEGTRATRGGVFSTDGKKAFGGRRQEKKWLSILFDLETGQEKEIYRPLPNPRIIPKFSPDGRNLAAVLRDVEGGRDTLLVIPLDGGEPRELLSVKQPEKLSYPWGLAWSRDGRYILFARGRTARYDLWRIPAGGGLPQKLGISMEGAITNLGVHPDRRRIVFTAVSGEARDELWVMENVLPELRAMR